MLLSRRQFAGSALAAAALTVGGAGHAQTLAPSAFQAEFDELFERLERAHFNLYANRSRAAHLREHARLRAQLGHVQDLPSALRIYQRFVAFGRVAHARIDAAGDAFQAYRQADGGIFPLTLRIKAGRVFVMADASGSPQVSAGDEVVSIEGEPAIRFLASLWPDLSADNEYMFHSMLEWALPRLLWGRLGARPEFSVKLRRGTGPTRQVAVPALSQARIDKAVLEPRPLDASPSRRERRISEGVGYLRPGPFYAVEQPDVPYDNRAFKRLVDDAFESFIEAKVDRLIIDLRDNPGGDSSFSDHLVSWFADRPFRIASAFRIKVSDETIASNRARLAVPGNDPTGISAEFARLYKGTRAGDIVDYPVKAAQPRAGVRFAGRVAVLVNRHSYSNAVNVAALIQDYGFGTVLGEETSDLATTYGAMEQFRLSRTGVQVGYPKARIIRPSGSLAARGVVPDITIDGPVVETTDDPVLSRAMAIMKQRPV
jgi:C-terminal processing protease CtpA/Prc